MTSDFDTKLSDDRPEISNSTRIWLETKLAEIESALDEGKQAAALAIVQETLQALDYGEEIEDSEGNWRRVTADRAKQTVSAIGSSIGKASGSVASAARSGASRVTETLSDAADYVSDNAKELIGTGVAGAAAGFSVAHNAFVEFASNLDWNTVVNAAPSDYVNRFVTAGTHGVDRTLEQAHLVWETIPESLRVLGPEEVSKRLWGAESAAERFDWSHRVAHSQGGSNEAFNGIFELASVNRARGAEAMTQAEYEAAAQVLADATFKAALFETASQVVSGAAVGAAVSLVLASLEYGLEYQQGRISREEMLQSIGRAVAQSAAVGAVVAGVMAIVALAFPAVIPIAAVVVAPLAILGFCAVGGKVVRLGKGWFDVYKDTFKDEVPGLRLGFQGNT